LVLTSENAPSGRSFVDHQVILGESADRVAEAMPPKQPPRPGLQQIAAAGDEWAAEKLAELDTALGAIVLIGNASRPSQEAASRSRGRT
jgi:hypothetical protein